MSSLHGLVCTRTSNSWEGIGVGLPEECVICSHQCAAVGFCSTNITGTCIIWSFKPSKAFVTAVQITPQVERKASFLHPRGMKLSLTYTTVIFDVDISFFANKILHYVKTISFFSCHVQRSHLMERKTSWWFLKTTEIGLLLGTFVQKTVLFWDWVCKTICHV